MNSKNYYNNLDDDDMNEKNITINQDKNNNKKTNANTNTNINNNVTHSNNHREADLENSNEENKGNFAMNLITNPQEAIAKELMSQGQQKAKGWFDKLKCNFEY